MLRASLTNVLARWIDAHAAALERVLVGHGVLPDILAIAAGIAFAILAILVWSVGRFCGLTLPAWYWALGTLGMTAATYAQLAQRRQRQETGERDRD
jgi:hypothetical protein